MKRHISPPNSNHGDMAENAADGIIESLKRHATSYIINRSDTSSENDSKRSYNSASPEYGSAVSSSFITKSFEIFSNEEYRDLCGWGPNGDTVIIHNIQDFSNVILPKYFKHKNFPSFVRQLHIYNFRKTIKDPSNGEFKHENFKKGRPDLLHLMKRKSSHPTTNSNYMKNDYLKQRTKKMQDQVKKDFPQDQETYVNKYLYSGNINMRECWPNDPILMELTKLRMWTKQLDFRIKDLETLNQNLNKSNDTLWKALQHQNMFQLTIQNKVEALLESIGEGATMRVGQKQQQEQSAALDWPEMSNEKMLPSMSLSTKKMCIPPKRTNENAHGYSFPMDFQKNYPEYISNINVSPSKPAMNIPYIAVRQGRSVEGFTWKYPANMLNTTCFTGNVADNRPTGFAASKLLNDTETALLNEIQMNYAYEMPANGYPGASVDTDFSNVFENEIGRISEISDSCEKKVMQK